VAQSLRDIDAIRFVWKTDITEDLAREKEWVVFDEQTSLMRYQFSRQDRHTLENRISQLGAGVQVGVNLGSLAVSYPFLDAALEVLGEDILAPEKWANWDPYAWIALCCRDESEWREEAAQEDRVGKTGIRQLEARFPDFYPKVAQLRALLESRTGRPLAVIVLDFGETFWVDLGLHLTLRRTMDALTADSDQGRATREMFGLPHERDRRGNIVVRSQVPESADIRDSVIVNSTIVDAKSVVHGAVIVGSKLESPQLPHGGCALFCAAEGIHFTGPHGIAFRSIGSQITLAEGGRYTTLLLPDGPVAMVSNESVLDYGGDNYAEPILDNPISFQRAGEMMASMEGQELERRWLQAWQDW
jgi:hypothetical protein